jgi:hypothetical protein
MIAAADVVLVSRYEAGWRVLGENLLVRPSSPAEKSFGFRFGPLRDQSPLLIPRLFVGFVDATPAQTTAKASASIRVVKNFTIFLGRSPDTASNEDLRRFQLHLSEKRVGAPTINLTISGLRLVACTGE